MNYIEAAANWAWDTSLAASALIVPALLFSLIFRSPRLTPIRRLLGVLIVARLLLPVSLPSPTSIFNFIQPQRATTQVVTSHSSQRIVGAEATTLASPPPVKNQSLVTSAPTIIWILGVLFFFAQVAFQRLKVRRWLIWKNRITEGPAIEALSSALKHSNCRRTISLYAIDGLHTPALLGLFRPAILLPGDLAKSGDAARLRLVYLHEIAHLRRQDVLINWLMIVAQSLHWFNPLVWLTLRRLRADQELLCDEDVMRQLRPEEHHTYGETLLALASPGAGTFSTLIPVSSNFKQLKERIGMIKQFKPSSRRLVVLIVPALAAALAMMTFTAATQKNAAPIAKAPDKSRAEKDRALENLEKQFVLQNNEVLDMERRVDDLRKVLGVLADTEADLLKDSETVRRVESDRIKAQQEYIQNKHVLAELKKKKQKDLAESLPAAYRDAVLENLLLKLHDSQQQLVGLQVEKTDDHPECQRIRAVVKYLSGQIDERANGIISGLETTTESKKAIVDELNKQITEMKIQEAQFLERARPYFTAKRDLETHQKLRDSIYLRLLEQKADRAMSQ